MKRLMVLLMLAPALSIAQQAKTTYYCFGADAEVLIEVKEKLTLDPRTKGEVISFGHPDAHFIADASGDIGSYELSQMRMQNEVKWITPLYETEDGHMMTTTDLILVKLKNTIDQQILENACRKLNLELVERNQFDPKIFKVRITDPEMDTKAYSDLLKATGLFHHVQPNYLHTLDDCAVEVDDQYFNRQWNLLNEGTGIQGGGTAGADMNIPEAWEITMGSPLVKVAILDSGVDTLHPDLIDRLEPGFDGSGEGSLGFPTPNFDEDGHGTCCAGIVAATANNDEGIAGVAPECGIVPIRVFNYIDLGGVQPWAEAEWFIDGINFAWQSGADVGSNSWGIPDALLALFPGDDILINEAIDDAVELGREGLGMPMFFSSGNDGNTDSIPIWPARYHNTIAVNSTSMCDERKSLTSCDGENWEGNWGNYLDIAAPGVRIPATDMQGADGFTGGSYYYYFNGTSSACPNAAGVAALILSDFWWITADLLESIIKQTCDKVGGYDYATNLDDGTWGPELGHGRIDALAALELAPALSVEEGIDGQSDVRAYSTRNGIGLLTGFDQPETLSIDIFDLNGRRVFTKTERVGGGTVNSEIVLPNQAISIQLIRISWDGGVETIKVLR